MGVYLAYIPIRGNELGAEDDPLSQEIMTPYHNKLKWDVINNPRRHTTTYWCLIEDRWKIVYWRWWCLLC